MNNDETRHSAFAPAADLLTPGLLPDDFARRVITRARVVAVRRQRRRRVLGGVAALLLIAILPVATFLRSSIEPPAAPEVASTAPASLSDTTLTAGYAQLARATAPAQISDYFAPAAASLADFDQSAAASAWYYDSTANDDR
jgi:hypothetical protein